MAHIVLAWLALSVPASIFVGSFIRVGMREPA
jgi:hypothetical protein